MTTLLKLFVSLSFAIVQVAVVGLMVGFFFGAVVAGFRIFPW
jgi:hypothetical protein